MPIPGFGPWGADQAYACADCPAGRARTETQQTFACVECPVGKYSVGGKAECSVCEGDTNVVNDIRTNCIACPAGKGPNAAHTQCLLCTDNTVSSTGVCVECPAQTYPMQDRVSCQPYFQCTDGTFCNAVDCTQQNENDNDCQQCPAGRVSTAGADCTACDGAGRVNNTEQSACESCGLGEAPTMDHSQCIQCSGSTYSAFVNHTIECAECVAPNVVNEGRTSCAPCASGQGPNDDHTGCVSCEGNTVSTIGVCHECTAGRFATDEHITCRECPAGQGVNHAGDGCEPCPPGEYSPSGICVKRQCEEALGEIEVNGTCHCAAGFYDASFVTLTCSEGCHDTNSRALISRDQTVHKCTACTSCFRCVSGPTGASVALLEPGFGLPASWTHRSLQHILDEEHSSLQNSDHQYKLTVDIYRCPLSEMCPGDHFTASVSTLVDMSQTQFVEQLLPVREKTAAIATNDPDTWYATSELTDAQRTEQAVYANLAVAAGIRISAEAALETPSLLDLNVPALSRVMECYYAYALCMDSQNTSVMAGSAAEYLQGILQERCLPEGDNARTEDGSFTTGLPIPFHVPYVDRGSDARLVIPDKAQMLSGATLSAGGESTQYNCAAGYDEDKPLCAVCTHGWAGGSTSICRYCGEGAIKKRLGGVIAALIFGYIVVVELPRRLIRKSRQQLVTLQKATQHENFVMVGASGEQASALVYLKIITSHFQVLLQFPVVLNIEFPEEFQEFLGYLSVLKGDVLNFLNLKCALAVGLFSEFTIAMLLVPFALMLLLVAEGVSAAIERRRRRRSGNIFQVLEESFMHSEFEHETTMASQRQQSSVASGTQGLLNRMFIVLFCIYPFLATRTTFTITCSDFLATGN